MPSKKSTVKKKATKKKKKKKIKIWHKPLEPVRSTEIRERWDLEDGVTSVQDLVNWAAQWNIPLDAVRFDTEYWYDHSATYFELIREETDAEFKVRVNGYKERLKEYEQWEKQNKEAIEEAKREKEEKEKAKAEKKRERLEKELAQLEKEVERRRKQLEGKKKKA